MNATEKEEIKFHEETFFKTILGFMGKLYGEATYRSGTTIKITGLSKIHLKSD